MKWKEHDRWASKLFGISERVSRDINRIVDAGDMNDIKQPSEFKKALKKCEQEKKSRGSGSAFSMVVSEHVRRSHDAGSSSKTGSDLAAEWELCAIKKMSEGDEHVKAWRLHYYLDYLDQNATGNKTLRQLIDEYRSYHAVPLHSEEVEENLLEYEEQLAAEVNAEGKQNLSTEHGYY